MNLCIFIDHFFFYLYMYSRPFDKVPIEKKVPRRGGARQAVGNCRHQLGTSLFNTSLSSKICYHIIKTAYNAPYLLRMKLSYLMRMVAGGLDTSFLNTFLYSIIHCHIIKTAYSAPYLLRMKLSLRITMHPACSMCS
jgi:hypothetical protein